MADGKKDIHTAGSECLTWDNNDPAKSLQDLRAFVEDEAQKATAWYWREKNGKKNPSQAIQFLSLTLTASGALAPIVIQLLKNAGVARLQGFDSGPVASLLVGLAAGLIGLDKAFGYSSGWTRYVLTATSMTKALQEFRLDWVALYAGTTSPPSAEQQAKLIQLAKSFISTVQGLLMQETRDWATEFQSNMAQMEKDVRTQLETLKSQVEKIAREREAADLPGAIELTVVNADKADAFHFDVLLENKAGSLPASVSNSKIWTQINALPGHYKVTVDAKAKGNPVSTSTTFFLKPGETEKPSLTLPGI